MSVATGGSEPAAATTGGGGGNRVFFQSPRGGGGGGSSREDSVAPAAAVVQVQQQQRRHQQGKVTVKYDRKELRKRLVLEEWIVEQLGQLYGCEVPACLAGRRGLGPGKGVRLNLPGQGGPIVQLRNREKTPCRGAR